MFATQKGGKVFRCKLPRCPIQRRPLAYRIEGLHDLSKSLLLWWDQEMEHVNNRRTIQSAGLCF